jgi:hypothetical protein
MCALNATAVAREAADLAKRLSNPVAALVSAPFQLTPTRTSGLLTMVNATR